MSNPTHHNSAAAESAVDSFIALLESEGLQGFAASFRTIGDALRTGDVRHAVQLYGSVPVGGMGGLSDIYARDQPAFDRAWGVVGRAFAALRAEISNET